MSKVNLRTPITYYGGKQKLASLIISLIPGHNLYCEPFIGGGAVFFAKQPSTVEVINDTSQEAINFYRVAQNHFERLNQKIQVTLHSRKQHHNAKVMLENPNLFDEVDRAWAFWVQATQSFSSIVGSSWGYDISKRTTSKKVMNKREGFTTEIAIRLQDVQIECTDALRIIVSRDREDSFFYCDPPYFNSDCGHYDGYTEQDFRELLETLSKIKGKFLLSSYPSQVLQDFTDEHGWYKRTEEQTVSAQGHKKRDKKKIEVLTANYPI